jgi:hypothetical protein
MSPMLQFIRPFDSFDSATLQLLGRAFDRAMASLHDRGQPNIVREVVAIRLLDLAAKGERDIDRLCAGAVVHVGE